MTMPDPIQTELFRIQQLQWELHDHPPYSSYLAPSDCHLFGPLQNHLRGECFADDEEVETQMRKWLRQQSKDFYAAGFDALVKRWDKCINVGGGYVEKHVFPGSDIIYFMF
jgi:hypothetical protein